MNFFLLRVPLIETGDNLRAPTTYTLDNLVTAVCRGVGEKKPTVRRLVPCQAPMFKHA